MSRAAIAVARCDPAARNCPAGDDRNPQDRAAASSSCDAGLEAFAAGTADALTGCMLDLVFVAVTVGFFALGVIYTRGCDRL